MWIYNYLKVKHSSKKKKKKEKEQDCQLFCYRRSRQILLKKKGFSYCQLQHTKTLSWKVASVKEIKCRRSTLSSSDVRLSCFILHLSMGDQFSWHVSLFLFCFVCLRLCLGRNAPVLSMQSPRGSGCIHAEFQHSLYSHQNAERNPLPLLPAEIT